tara:strand:+ start:270 stop:800 length:531 start_codon:yes stop_codon:yes gene_type:complete
MKIGFCGTMSVGKTTLVNALKEDEAFKNYKFATERSKYLSSLGIPLNTDSTYKGQIIFSAERAAELLQENMITDRTVIDVIAFSRLSKQMSKIEKTTIEHILCQLIQDYDIIFHIDDLSIPIEDNGVRETDKKYREEIALEIDKIIGNYIPDIRRLVRIFGSTEERVSQVKASLSL